ncbi:MAG: N-acetylmuramoyl-L-alanine amidase [Clostridia bacterium]|nr:N-acetylmuramoyl-L-alanine amidase [Clostridia bacterium]
MTSRTKPSPLSFLWFLLLLTAMTLLLAGIANRIATAETPTLHPTSTSPEVVILDAGHGGEDGGAVSGAGVPEKELNLAIAALMETLLESNGVHTVMTRTEDILLYDRTQDYHGRKKALDLAARLAVGNQYPAGIFVSIHMNSYPLPQYHGLQVWYSPNHGTSQGIAEQMQSTVAATLQPENDRCVKAAGSNIYLLHHLQCPAVLVECGFLSNPTEAERLSTPEYQRQLALLLTLALMEYENPTEK